MKKINFLIGIHNHQPVGNFERVFEKGFQKCYRPFLEIMEKHPSIRFSLHYTGPLLEWMEKREPHLLDLIQNMVRRNQVEMLGGGFYEPIFSLLRDEDILNQIWMLREFTEKRFGYSPAGIWLAERVWDSSLPKILVQAGVKYTILDDLHFRYAGLPPEEIFGYYLTEKEGLSVAVFPIDKRLRYSIPFKPPEETIEYLTFLASDNNGMAVTYADDGEKFGMWPGTHQWVYHEWWLGKFLSLLEENADLIKTMTFSDYLHSFPPMGRIYLPNASYEEMMEWALPTSFAIQYQDMVKELKGLNREEKYKPFLRGGMFDNFLIKYPESNLMHKKMLWVSEKVNGLNQSAQDVPYVQDAKRELYQGQCNCAYWHGLFGGLYLNHLRHAVYEHLINAEKIADKLNHPDETWLDFKLFDLDRDSNAELLISNQKINLYFKPGYGGSLFEWDYKPESFNLTNVLARRVEAYHRKLKEAEDLSHRTNSREPKSIHDLMIQKEKGLEEILRYDWYNRHSFLDHFLGSETTFESFQTSSYPELGDFVNQPYKVVHISRTPSREEIQVTLEREGHLWEKGGEKFPIRIRKCFTVRGGSSQIEVVYQITNQNTVSLHLWFGIEFSFNLLLGDDPKRYYSFPGREVTDNLLSSTGKEGEVATICLRDEWKNFEITCNFDHPAEIWRFPLETVSQSEEGFERTYQGSVILSHWKLELGEGESKIFRVLLNAGIIKGLESSRCSG